MQIVSNTTGPLLSLARKPIADLSREAKMRLGWLDWHRVNGSGRAVRHAIARRHARSDADQLGSSYAHPYAASY